VLCSRHRENASCTHKRSYYLDTVETIVVEVLRQALLEPESIHTFVETYVAERRKLNAATVKQYDRAKPESQKATLGVSRQQFYRALGGFQAMGLFDRGKRRILLRDKRKKGAGRLDANRKITAFDGRHDCKDPVIAAVLGHVLDVGADGLAFFDRIPKEPENGPGHVGMPDDAVRFAVEFVPGIHADALEDCVPEENMALLVRSREENIIDWEWNFRVYRRCLVAPKTSGLRRRLRRCRLAETFLMLRHAIDSRLDRESLLQRKNS